MQNLSAKDLIGELILATYESGYYSALNQLELVGVAVAKRKIAREELERRLTLNPHEIKPLGELHTRSIDELIQSVKDSSKLAPVCDTRYEGSTCYYYGRPWTTNCHRYCSTRSRGQ